MSAASKAVTIPPPAPSAAVVPISDAASILQIIERAARDPNVDVDKMERLFRMHQEMRDKQAEREFNVAMQAAQAQLPKVLKDRANDHTKSRYATLEAIIKAINPVVTSHGFAMSFGTEDSPYAGHYRVTCVVSHTAGHTREYHADVPADAVGAKGTSNKNPIQAVGSAITYARRYLTTLIFNVSTGEDDDDGQAATSRRTSPPPAPHPGQEQDWIAKIENAGDKVALNKVLAEIAEARLGDEAEERILPYVRRRKQDLANASKAPPAQGETVHVPESRQGRQPLPKEPVEDPTNAETDAEPIDSQAWLEDVTSRMRQAKSIELLTDIWETDCEPRKDEVPRFDYQEASDTYNACREKLGA